MLPTVNTQLTMIRKVLLTLSAITLCLGQSANSPAIDWIQRSGDGAYKFGYATGDEGKHYHVASASADNVVAGKFGFKDPATGADLQTTYTAGRRGFRARGPHIARRMDLSQNKPPFSRPNDDGKYHPELDNTFDPNEDRGYDFSFRNPDQVKEEHANSIGDVRGGYSYLDDVGIQHTVDYIAGSRTGFQVTNPVPDTFAQAQGGPLRFVGKSPGSKARGFSAVQKNGDGSYTFAASGPDHKRNEVVDALGNRRGSYTFLDDKGVQHTVEYIAGANIGFKIINNSKEPNFNPPYPFFPTVSTLGPTTISTLFPSSSPVPTLFPNPTPTVVTSTPSGLGGSSGGTSTLTPIGSSGYYPGGSSGLSPGGSSGLSPGGSSGSSSGGSSGLSPGSSSGFPPGGSSGYPPGGSSEFPPGGSSGFPPGGSSSLSPGGSSTLSPGGSSGLSPGGSSGFPHDGSLGFPHDGSSGLSPGASPTLFPGGSSGYTPSLASGLPHGSSTPGSWSPSPTVPSSTPYPGSTIRPATSTHIYEPDDKWDIGQLFPPGFSSSKHWPKHPSGAPSSTPYPYPDNDPFLRLPNPVYLDDVGSLHHQLFSDGLNTAETGAGLKPPFKGNDVHDCKNEDDSHERPFFKPDSAFQGAGRPPSRGNKQHENVYRGDVKFGGVRRPESSSGHKGSPDGFFRIPTGVAVRAHVQSLDIVPYNKRFVSPGEALERYGSH